MSKQTLIIGGVAGGATAAARLRRRQEEGEIIIFERGEYISYANCGLPYFIGDTIKSRDALLLQTPEAMKAKFNIDVRVQNEVIQILPKEKKVRVRNLKTDEVYEECYEQLVIATGSSPVKPRIKGIDNENIFTVWTVKDTDHIKQYIEQQNVKNVAVIGGGFIGLEMAENLHHIGCEVSLIEMQDQVMAPLDKEMANLLHENMMMNGVQLILKDGVKEFHKVGEKTKIELASERFIEADMVVLSIGVKPNGELAKEAGIACNERGGIIVDEYLQTSIPDIYAVGDVIEVEQYVTKQKAMIPLAGPANKQARILADNLCGDKKKYKGSLGTSIAQVFDLHAASTGINEKQLLAMGKEKGKDYETVLINQKSHAGYYPGATPITIKLIFTREGMILGAQIVGQDGVDKRIDTIATTMGLNGTVFDLEELELAYAPPFSSAKDPVNMIGFVAENVINHRVSFITCQEFDELLEKEEEKDYIVLDVTEEIERMVFAIPNSYHIPLGQLRGRLAELEKEKLIIPYCAVGVRSYNAARILMQHGFQRVKVLEGGTSFYKSMHNGMKEKGVEITSQIEENKEKESIKKESIGEESIGKEVIRKELIREESRGKEVMRKESIGKKSTEEEQQNEKEITLLDCCGLQCPGPIMKVNEAIKEMKE